MIKTYSVFIRTNADGNQQDDMNVLSQHYKTYAGIVRGDSMERAVVNAVQKTGKPSPFLLIYEGEVSIGENAAFCPHCGKNLGDAPDPKGPNSWTWEPGVQLWEKLNLLMVKDSPKDYECPHCQKHFTGKVESVLRTMFFQAPDAK